MSDMIVRPFKTDRNRTPQEMLNATGRVQYTDKSVVKGMPRGEGEEGEVVFFKLDRYLLDDDIEKEFELRGLKPADPYSLAAVNEADPAFADTHPNGTHWKDAEGNWCFVTFNRWDDEREVNVDRSEGEGVSGAWFAGLRRN